MRDALIVGAGGSGFLHALALRAAGLRIATVYDPDLERAALLASVVGGAPADDLAAALGCDAAVAAICSPPPFHVAQAEALVRPGRLVFLEKPIATTRAGLERLRRLADVVPVLQWRAGRAARDLRVAIAAGAFGPRPALRFDLRLWRDEAYFASGRRGREQWGCGAMLSLGIHAIDLVLWLVGRPLAGACGREWRGRPEIDVATAGELTIAFAGGARAEIALTFDAPGANDVRLEVHGGGSSSEIRAGEADPTAGPAGSPLLVPFVADALAAFDAGRPALSVADVADAHALALGLGDVSPSARRRLWYRAGIRRRA